MSTLMPPCPRCGAEGAQVYKWGIIREAHGEAFTEEWCECLVCGFTYDPYSGDQDNA